MASGALAAMLACGLLTQKKKEEDYTPKKLPEPYPTVTPCHCSCHFSTHVNLNQRTTRYPWEEPYVGQVDVPEAPKVHSEDKSKG